MAWNQEIIVLVLLIVSSFSVLGSPATKNGRGGKSGNGNGGGGGGGGGGPKTCPGYPGYCSESYPGDTCLVVCAFGRNNVPECQADGTWTDIPRCIEHEPGIPEQVPGLCPGIPGYCSIDYPGGVCEFDCITGPDIRSFCTPDGTWDPYPTCDGDVRETRDGCDPCPGPFGGPRNRTIEASSGTAPARTPAAPKPAPQQAAAPARGNNGNKQPAQNNNNRQQQQPPNNNRQQQQPPAQNNRQQQPPAQNNRQQQQPPAQNNRQQQQPPAQNNRQQQKPAPILVIPKSNADNGGGNNAFSNGNPAQHQPQQQPQQKFQQSNNQGGGSSGGCPGGSLESCIDVCPSDSTRVFGACVNGCAKRCPTKK